MKIRSIAVPIVAGCLSIGIMANPASAAMSDCISGRFCIFENNDFNAGASNNIVHWSSGDGDYTNNSWPNTTDSIDNETSSIYNRTLVSVRLYQHVGYSGDYSEFTSGASDGFLANNTIGDNRASSHVYF